MTLKTLLVSSLLLFSVSSFAQSLSLGSNQFCMQTFNAYGPPYATQISDRTQRMDKDLRGNPVCDVVHLQEVWNQSQLNIVTGGLRDLFQISSPNKTQRIGVMSLFRGNIDSTETHIFKVNNIGGILDNIREKFNVRKAFHIVRATLPNTSEDFYFMNTHLHPTKQSIRVVQILDLLDWRLAHQDLKMLLSGDFNADVSSIERIAIMMILGMYDSYQEALGGIYPKGLCTYCAANPRSWLRDDHIFDYIFFSNVGETPTALHALSGEINLKGTPKNTLSDHYGLKMQFELEAGTAMDRREQETRDQKVIKTLTVMRKVLTQKTVKEFAPYIAKLNYLIAQMETHNGPFYEYTESFR